MGRPQKNHDVPPIFAVKDAKSGGLTDNQMQRKGLRKVVHGVRSVSNRDFSLLERAVAVARSIPHSVIASVSVAQIAGWRLPQRLEKDETVYLLTTNQRLVRRQGISCPRSYLEESEYLAKDGYLITTIERTFLDLGTLLTEEELIILADGILCFHQHRRGQGPTVTREKLDDYLRNHQRHPGKRKCLRALARAAAGSDSPQETRLRLLLEGYGVTGLATNPPIRNELGWVMIEPDLADFEHQVSIQYEGAHHGSARQMRKDEDRLRKTQELGWIEVKIFASDLTEFVPWGDDFAPRAVAKVKEAQYRAVLKPAQRN